MGCGIWPADGVKIRIFGDYNESQSAGVKSSHFQTNVNAKHTEFPLASLPSLQTLGVHDI